MKSNYHTHTSLCNHATGNVEDYVKEAIKQKLESIGMSDHVPYPDDMFDYCDDEFSRKTIYRGRMKFEEMDKYLNDIEICQHNYGDKIRILKAYESEYIYGKDEYYKSLLDDVDYLVLGQHYIYKEENGRKTHSSSFTITDERDVELYKEQAITGLKTGMFKIFAHPDLCFRNFDKFNIFLKQVAVELIETAISENVVLEYNANGLRDSNGYPHNDFWKIVANYEDAMVMINSDCHHPEDLNDINMKTAEDRLKQLGIKYLEKLDI